jgi:cytochrome c biogenesis protein
MLSSRRPTLIGYFMADVSIKSNPKQSRSTLEVVVDKIWRFFTSVRNAIYEIAFLTLLVLIGTLRGSSVPQWIADGIPGLQPLVDRWYAWDVFRSPVFAGTLAVITVAIIICTLNRVPGIWAVITHPKITTTRGFLRGAETNAVYTTSTAIDSVESSIETVLKQKRYRVLTEQVGDETHFYADKNRWSKLGTFPFHLGLILILVGGIVASVYGFRDNEFVIPEGSRRNVGHGTGLSVELNRFRDNWSAIGVPIDYRSDITIYEGGEPVKSGSVQVNGPLSYGNATFYQSSFGTAAQMKIMDSSGNVVYSDATDLGLFTKRDNPDAPAGVIQLPLEGVQLILIGPDSDPFNQPELDTMQLQSGQLWISLEALGENTDVSGSGTEGIVLTQGEPQRVGDYTITFERESRFTVLQVGYNPGIPIFIIAVFWLLGGLIVTFYFPHRRIRGIISSDPEGTVANIAPLAKRDWSGKREFFSIVEKVNEQLGVKPVIRLPDNASDYEYLRSHPVGGTQTR